MIPSLKELACIMSDDRQDNIKSAAPILINIQIVYEIFSAILTQGNDKLRSRSSLRGSYSILMKIIRHFTVQK